MRSFVVIGSGRFGSSLARTLYELGNEVMVIDSSPERIAEISNDVTYAVEGDITDENLLHDLGLSNFDVAIVAITSDLEASVIATLAAKDLGIPQVIAKAHSEMHSRILFKIGADKVVYPEQDMGVRVAHNLNSTNILDFIEFSSDYNIAELMAFKEWENRTLEDLSLTSEYGVTILALRRAKELIITPRGDEKILRGDTLVIIGRVEDVEKLEKK